MYWETTGTVLQVWVDVGDHVRAGDILMDLDPLSVPQNVIMAQADLISARKSLYDLNNPTKLQISNARKVVDDAQEDMEQLQNPTSLSVANAQQAVADAREYLELLETPSSLGVANAQQEVADAEETLSDLQNPSLAQIASAEELVALGRDDLRDKQEALNELLDPDIETLEDKLRDAEFELARAQQDVELASIGTSTSKLENAGDALEDMQERRIKVQKALDACIVYSVEQEEDREYTQLTVEEEIDHAGFTYLVGSVYEVFQETATLLIEQHGAIVKKKPSRVCDPLRAVTVDGVTRTLEEADDDVRAAEDGLREAQLQTERTMMGNTTALDLASEAVQDARKNLDEAMAGGDLIDISVAQAAVDDAAADLEDAEKQLVQMMNPHPEDVAVATGKLDDAREKLQQILAPRPEDVAVATGQLEDTDKKLSQLLDPSPADLEMAEATLLDAQDQLKTLLLGPDKEDVAAAEARVMAAEATLRSLSVAAPFDGQILAVNYLPGDAAEPSISAVRLANIDQLRVEVSVDETEVRGISIGQPAILSFDALPSMELDASVTHVAQYGDIVQGLVRYPVTVTLSENTPNLMLGMTSHVQIVTDVLQDALAVPIDAVQYDDEGEYLMIFNGFSDPHTRVSIESGVIQGEHVVVNGEIEAGQKVILFTPKPTESGSPFGGGD